MFRVARVPCFMLAAVAIAGCRTTTDLGPVPPVAAALAADSVIAVRAPVRYLNLEGGCWVLATSTGRYEPVNLPTGFKVDGRNVTAVLRGAPDVVSRCMVGPLVHLDSIAPRH